MSLKEIFDSSSAAQRNKILAGIMQRGISYSTAFAWCSGSRPPRIYLRPIVIEVVNAETGIEHTEKELWPEG